MHFRKGIVSTALSLALLMPSFASANNDTQPLLKGKSLSFHTNKIAVEQVLITKPDLTPEVKAKLEELKSKLKNGEITKDQFHQEIKKVLPEGFHYKHKKKGCHKELSDEARVKLDELKSKFKNGEITKEEFRKEMKKIIHQNTEFDEQ